MADLIARAREQGAVAVGDIAVAIDSSDLPAQELDGIVRMLTAEGVEVVDAAHEDAEPPPRLSRPRRRAARSPAISSASTCARSAGSRC